MISNIYHIMVSMTTAERIKSVRFGYHDEDFTKVQQKFNWQVEMNVNNT